MSVEERVKTVIVNILGVTDDVYKPEANLMDDLHADSLDTVDICMELGEEFGIEIPDKDVEKMRTVQDVINYVTEKTKT